MELILDGSKKTYEINESLELIIKGQNNFDEVLVVINHASNIKISGEFSSGSYRIIYINNTDESINIEEEYHCLDADVKISHGNFSQENINITQKVYLEDGNAHLETNTYSLVKGTIKIKEEVFNVCHHTVGIINNYAICLKEGTLDIYASGIIEKGSNGAQSHQTSKALTFGNPKMVQIEPLLLIDENDVEASHATSIGRMDENQLFYLKSRGLSDEQITELLTMGYLLPLTRIFEDEERNKNIKDIIEKKVAEIC